MSESEQEGFHVEPVVLLCGGVAPWVMVTLSFLLKPENYPIFMSSFQITAMRLDQALWYLSAPIALCVLGAGIVSAFATQLKQVVCSVVAALVALLFLLPWCYLMFIVDFD